MEVMSLRKMCLQKYVGGCIDAGVRKWVSHFCRYPPGRHAELLWNEII